MTRVAIVGGCRTPFVKAGGVFGKYSFLDLGVHCVSGAVKRLDLDPQRIDELVYSTVLLDPRTPNAARELVVRSNLPDTLSAHFISNNCISGLVAANIAREGILSGRISTAIAGGSESMSQPSLTFLPAAERFFLAFFRARSFAERLKILTQFRPKFLKPQPPSPKEPSTGLTMGQHCELMCKDFEIPREIQDQLAFMSHERGAAAQEAGYLAEEIEPLNGVEHDNIIRADTSLEKLAKLRPVFDRSDKGSITAGNASPLTDGASAICLMSEEAAQSQGKKILGYLEDCEFAAIPPSDGLLMAPALSLPRLMKRNNLSVSDVDMFEVHEAFAAQVAANMKTWNLGWDKYPDVPTIGEIPLDKYNLNGGSIAIGHPFAATGGRLILAVVNHLQRTNQNTGIISVCAAGAMGCAMLIRRS